MLVAESTNLDRFTFLLVLRLKDLFESLAQTNQQIYNGWVTD